MSEKGGRLSFLFFFLVGGALDANLPLLSLLLLLLIPLSLFPRIFRSPLTLQSSAARVARDAGQPRERFRLPSTRANAACFSFFSVSSPATSVTSAKEEEEAARGLLRGGLVSAFERVPEIILLVV